MVVTQDDRASQILVIPPSSSPEALQQSRNLIETIISRDNVLQHHSNPTRIYPWHIANRYYEADVHFKLSEVALQAQPSSGLSKAQRAPRQARMIDDESRISSRVGDISTQEDDADLSARVKDVFEALQIQQRASGTQTPSSRHGQDQHHAHSRALAKQLQGVQAVVIVVDRDSTLEAHRRLLSYLHSSVRDEQPEFQSEVNGIPMLSGFDLAVSLVIALPTLGTESAASPRGREVEVLYAGEGWEYIDLAREAEEENDEAISEGSGEDDSDSQELEGIDRIREALMAHTWPGLVQSNGRRRTHEAGNVSRQSEVGNAPNSDEAADRLSQLRLHIDEMDSLADKTEPTERDEELARAFMERINELDNRDRGALGRIAGNTASVAQESADMQAALERFLESEDGTWPRTNPSAASWPQSAAEEFKGESGTAQFDDDFTDFQSSQSGQRGDLTQDADDVFSGHDWPASENSFRLQEGIRAEDDELLDRFLAHSKRNAESDPHLDFEATLSAVMAHTERVRAIPDHEVRRQEAARVALALLDQS